MIFKQISFVIESFVGDNESTESTIGEKMGGMELQ
jgi:hypothetical protein